MATAPRRWPWLTLVAALAVAGCNAGGSAAGPGGRDGMAERRSDDPQDRFFARLATRCGQAFPGAIASNDAADADLAGRPLVIHVADCTADTIRIPMHVGPRPGATGPAEGAGADGWDRSRTWVIRRVDGGLQLTHEHRHADGSFDTLTGYGGRVEGQGTAERQEFPVDASSQALFRRTGRTVSLSNRWSLSVAEPGQSGARLTYALTRPAPDARDFRAVFDLTRPAPPPPPAWGPARR